MPDFNHRHLSRPVAAPAANSLTLWLNRLFTRPASRPATRRATLEPLENRALLAAVSWDAGGDGVNWHDALNWSTNSLPTSKDDVTISVAANPSIVFSKNDVIVNSLSTDEQMTFTGGSLTVTSIFDINDSAIYLSGGAIKDTHIVSDAAGILYGTTTSTLLYNITLDGNLDLTTQSANIKLGWNFILNGTAKLGDLARINISSGSINGAANIQFQGHSAGLVSVNTSFNLGTDVHIFTTDTATGVNYIGANPDVPDSVKSIAITNRADISAENGSSKLVINSASLISYGTIKAANDNEINVFGLSQNRGVISTYYGASVRLDGDWQNLGTLQSDYGSLYLAGKMSKGLGTLVSNAGSTYLTGSLQIVNSLTLDKTTGSLIVHAGTITGGSGNSITTKDDQALIVTPAGATFNQLTIFGDIDLTQDHTFANINGYLSIDGTASLGSYSRLYLENGGVLTRPNTHAGRIKFVGHDGAIVINTGTLNIYSGIEISNDSSTTGPNYVGGSPDYPAGPDTTIKSAGAIFAHTPGSTIIIDVGSGSIYNSGSITASPATTIKFYSALINTRFVSSFANSFMEFTEDLPYTGVPVFGFGLGGNTLFTGTASGLPQVLEINSKDYGATSIGFEDNAELGRIILAQGITLKLANADQNRYPTGDEALYVGSLIVPSGTTLDLNGIHAYARTTDIQGTIINGTVEVVPDIRPLTLGVSSKSDLSVLTEVDHWTFTAPADKTLNITLVSGPNDASSLQWANIEVVAPNGDILASHSNLTPKATIIVPPITTSQDGTYTIRIKADPANPGSTGSYTVSAELGTPTVLNLSTFPAPRTSPVLSVAVRMSALVNLSTFNWQDLTLSRDAGPNLATSAITIAVSPTDSKLFTITLPASLVNPVGAYSLTVNGLSINSQAGNAFANSNSTTWNIIAAVPSSPTLDPASEGKPGSGFTQYTTPTLKGTASPGSTVEVYEDTTLLGTGTAAADGKYAITLSTLSSGTHTLKARATDHLGTTTAFSTNSTITVETATPTISNMSVYTAPRAISVTTTGIRFSSQIDLSTFTAADLTLTRNDNPVSTAGITITVSPSDPKLYTINIPAALNPPDGDYVLQVTGSGIKNLAGSTVGNSASTSWTILPRIMSLSQYPAARTIPVTSPGIRFSSPINLSTFTWEDITLTRNGSGNLATSAITIVHSGSDPSLYTIFIPAALTNTPGGYTLTVAGAGIQSLTGFTLTNSLSTTWTQL